MADTEPATAALEALRDDLARWDADDLTDLERLRIELWQEKGV